MRRPLPPYDIEHELSEESSFRFWIYEILDLLKGVRSMITELPGFYVRFGREGMTYVKPVRVILVGALPPRLSPGKLCYKIGQYVRGKTGLGSLDDVASEIALCIESEVPNASAVGITFG